MKQCNYAPPVCTDIRKEFRCPPECKGKVTVVRKGYFAPAVKLGKKLANGADLCMCKAHADWWLSDRL